MQAARKGWVPDKASVQSALRTCMHAQTRERRPELCAGASTGQLLYFAEKVRRWQWWVAARDAGCDTAPAVHQHAEHALHTLQQRVPWAQEPVLVHPCFLKSRPTLFVSSLNGKPSTHHAAPRSQCAGARSWGMGHGRQTGSGLWSSPPSCGPPGGPAAWSARYQEGVSDTVDLDSGAGTTTAALQPASRSSRAV